MSSAQGAVNQELLPHQFKEGTSDLEVLGLADETEISREMVQEAHRRIIAKYHPDKLLRQEVSLGKEEANYISSRINTARDNLYMFIDLQGPIRSQSEWDHSGRGYQDPSQPADFADRGRDHYTDNFWGAQFQQDPSLRGLVLNGQGRGVDGTPFEGLPRNVSTLFMHFKMYEPDQVQNIEMLLVFHREIFPYMEVRFIRNSVQSGAAPVFVASHSASYFRTFHKGETRGKFPAIVFSDGSYLIFKTYFHLADIRPVQSAGGGMFVLTGGTNLALVGYPSPRNSNSTLRLSAFIFQQDIGRTYMAITGRPPAARAHLTSSEDQLQSRREGGAPSPLPAPSSGGREALHSAELSPPANASSISRPDFDAEIRKFNESIVRKRAVLAELRDPDCCAVMQESIRLDEEEIKKLHKLSGAPSSHLRCDLIF